MLAEAKAKIVYQLVRHPGERVAEKLLPPIDFTKQVQPSNTFETRAREAYLQYQQTEDQIIRGGALTELSQQLVNLGRFRQARMYTQTLRRLALDLPEDYRHYYAARSFEKEAWINDYETGYFASRQCLEQAWIQVNKRFVPSPGLVRDTTDLRSTLKHFEGRSCLGLACQGVNRLGNLHQAMNLFQEDRRHFETLRTQGDPHPANEGFNVGWEAVCHMVSGNLATAGELIGKAKRLFEEHTQINPESAILAHYHLLEGARLLKLGAVTTARDHFRQSLDIREKKRERYPFGEALARLGITKSYLAERNLPQAADNFKMAVKQQPIVILHWINGIAF